MKKINLRGLSEILSEKELKNVMGGSQSFAGTCGWSGGLCCISKETALSLYNANGGNWCCDSCSSTSYCENAVCG